MFRMLVFLIALPYLMLLSWLGFVYLASGHITEGLPFAAITIMCGSYFLKGACETVDYIRSRIK